MPVVIFFSAIVNILYYFGAIQFILLKIAWMMNMLMGTSPTESVNSGIKQKNSYFVVVFFKFLFYF